LPRVSDGKLDSVFFTANSLLYAIYKDSANLAGGGDSATAHAIILTTAGGDAAAMAPSPVVASKDQDGDSMNDKQWRYYVRANASGVPDMFRFSTSDASDDLATQIAVSCLGVSIMSPHPVTAIDNEIAASGGYSYLAGTDGNGKHLYVAQVDASHTPPYASTCATGSGASPIDASNQAVGIDSLRLIFGGQSGASLVGNLYARGNDATGASTATTQALYYRTQGGGQLLTISDTATTAKLAADAVAANLNIADDQLFFSAVDTDASPRRAFVHSPSVNVNRARELQDPTGADTSPTNFIPFSDKTVPLRWAP
jgi:hypothetical protein